MHYSAKRGITIACRLHGQLAQHLRSLWPKGHPPTLSLPGEHGEILERLEVGWEKWRSGAQKRQYL